MSVKPFSEHGHYTAVHDAVFDVVMPFCPPNAFKVLLFVLRKTRGWKKDEDVLRYAEIKQGTGIKSDATLAKELDWLRSKKLLNARNEDGTPHVKGDRRAPAYSLNRDFELRVEAPEPTSETEAEKSESTSENEVRSTSETEASNNQQGKNHSRRDADASPKPTNYMTVFSEAAKLLNYKLSPEDRKDLPKHLKTVAEECSDELMREVVRRCLIARSERNYSLSPQRAKREIESGVRPIGKRREPDESEYRAEAY